MMMMMMMMMIDDDDDDDKDDYMIIIIILIIHCTGRPEYITMTCSSHRICESCFPNADTSIAVDLNPNSNNQF